MKKKIPLKIQLETNRIFFNVSEFVIIVGCQTKTYHTTMEEGFPLFLFSLLSLLLRKYCITTFFVYHVFVRSLGCTYLFNFMVYALQRTISYNANQKATFRSYIAESSRMNI